MSDAVTIETALRTIEAMHGVVDAARRLDSVLALQPSDHSTSVVGGDERVALRAALAALETLAPR